MFQKSKSGERDSFQLVKVEQRFLNTWKNKNKY